MKIIFFLLIVISTFNANAQLFSMLDSAGIITVNVPRKYKAYTYSKYYTNDSTLIIHSSKNEFDLIIRDPEKKQDYIILVPTSDRIKGKEHYKLKTGDPARFTVTSDQDYLLKSNKIISLDYIIDETGDFIVSPPSIPNDRFLLQASKFYGFKYIPEESGEQLLMITLFHDSIQMEEKSFPLLVTPGKINLYTQVKPIFDHGFEKVISYTITSSKPVLTDLDLSLTLSIQINSISEEIKVENILFEKNKTICSGIIRKPIKGRSPRKFIISSSDLRIKTEQSNAIYITH